MSYWTRFLDDTGEGGIHGENKLLKSLRILTEGLNLTSAGNMYGISSSSGAMGLKRFTKHVQIALAEYLEPRSKEGAKKILSLST